MFRRKEDSLFDNTTDPNQTQSETETTTATATAEKKTSGSSSSSSSSSKNYSNTSANNQSAQPNRPAADTRASSSAQSANSFRPASAPLSGDISRNRMPEAKATPAAPTTNMSVGTSSNGAPGRRVLTVGNDILLKGEIATCDRLVIEGKVDATLNDVHTVEIAETGSFKGSAHIEDAEISGLFEGDLIVSNRLVIYATGKVRGKITYGEIEIERGGEMTGEIKTSNPASQGASRPSKGDKAA